MIDEPALTCDEARRAFRGELTQPGLSARVLAHIAGCQPCQRFLAELRRRPGLMRMLAPPLPENRATAILSQLREALRDSRNR